MSASINPDIVTDGLILCLDAGNPASYPPGSGTVWTDLSGNGNNGTLTNGPVFNSANKGGIVFDGSNDYVNIGNKSQLFFLDRAFTLSCWARINGGTNTYRCFISHDRSTSVNTNIYEIGISSANKFYYYPGDQANVYGNTFAPTQNIWYYYAATATPNGASNIDVLLYVNGNLTDTISNRKGPVDPGSGNLYLGVDAPSGANQVSFLNGQIGNVAMYSRTLTAAEILQNYNATKGRYGL